MNEGNQKGIDPKKTSNRNYSDKNKENIASSHHYMMTSKSQFNLNSKPELSGRESINLKKPSSNASQETSTRHSNVGSVGQVNDKFLYSQANMAMNLNHNYLAQPAYT